MFKKIKLWWYKKKIAKAMAENKTGCTIQKFDSCFIQPNFDDLTKALAKVSVSIKNAGDSFKMVGNVLTELSKKWNDIGSIK